MSNAIDLCVTVLEQECVVAKPKRKGKEEDAEGADEAERPPPSGETLMALTALKVRSLFSQLASFVCY